MRQSRLLLEFSVMTHRLISSGRTLHTSTSSFDLGSFALMYVTNRSWSSMRVPERSSFSRVLPNVSLNTGVMRISLPNVSNCETISQLSMSDQCTILLKKYGPAGAG